MRILPGFVCFYTTFIVYILLVVSFLDYFTSKYSIQYERKDFQDNCGYIWSIQLISFQY